MTNKHLLDFKNPHFWRLLINIAALGIFIELQRRVVQLLGFYYGWIYLAVSAIFSFLLTKGLDWLALAAIQHYVIKSLDKTTNGEEVSYIKDCTRTSHGRRVDLITQFLEKYEYITSTWMYEMCPPNNECGTIDGLSDVGIVMLKRFINIERYHIGPFSDIHQLFNDKNTTHKQLSIKLEEFAIGSTLELFRNIVFYCNLMFLMTGDDDTYLSNLISYIGEVREFDVRIEEKTITTAISSKNAYSSQYIVNMLKTILRNHIDGVSLITARSFIFIRNGLQFYKKQSSRDDVIDLDNVPSHLLRSKKK